MITDISGVKVGQIEDYNLRSGVTAIVFDAPATASVDVRGGAPGTLGTDLLAPERVVEQIDAVVFSGGSAFGLCAADGAMAALAEEGRGFAIGKAKIPAVPAAVIFDLQDGKTKWEKFPPYREMGYEAVKAASSDFRLGSAGAGTGATTTSGKGGTGSASARTSFGATVGALAVVNAVGSANFRGTKHFFAAAFERNKEFGGYGLPSPVSPDMVQPQTKMSRAGESTTLALVTTDAVLTKAQCRHLAVMAQDGLAMALFPVHTLMDGDTVFAAATGAFQKELTLLELTELGALAATTLARAIARGVYEAKA